MCICNLMALWWNILLGLFPVFAELKYVSLCFVVLIAFLVLLEHEGVSSWSRALCAWWRAAETRRENANTSPGRSHSRQLGLPKGPSLTRHADTMQWGDGIAGDTFAEVTTARLWSEWPTAEELSWLLFGVSAPLVQWGDEERQPACTALTQKAPVYAARVCFPHYISFLLPEGTEYSFPLCHK